MQHLATYTDYIEREISLLDFPVKPANLYDPIRYFLQLGGKRIRPVLTLLGAEMFAVRKEDTLNAALAVEIFHNFSLIHDDIMDEAPLRRNNPTVHKKWNHNSAILAGDVLLVKAYQLIAQQKAKHVPELLNEFNKMAAEVCEGQQMDMDFEIRNDVTIAEYIEMIRLKTSVLLGCALKMGAIVAGADKHDSELLYQFGQHVGIAFQIQDDILDLYADPDKFGKQVGGDVIANKKTLLNLKAVDLIAGKEEMLTQLNQESDFKQKVSRAKELYELIGARQACELVMQQHYELAMQSLDKINVSEQYKQSLSGLAAFLMQREI
jgi:geranylgeranyl diphosphate synthase type II